MLTTFFVRSSVRARMQAHPTGPHLAAFATALHEQRYAHQTICQHLRCVDAFGRWLQDRQVPLAAVTTHQVAQYLVQLGRRPLHSRPEGAASHAAAVLPRFLAFLQAQGVISSLADLPPLTPTAHWLQRFTLHLQQVRGLAPQTCRGYLRFVHRFLATTGRAETVDWSTLRADELSEFVRREAHHRRGGGRKGPGTALHALVRFLVTEGEVSQGLDTAILTPREWTHAPVPLHFSREEITKLLAGMQDGTAIGLRNHAILLLLARLGLRAHEVMDLRLDDVNWLEGRLHIHSPKSHRVRSLPVDTEVGTALATYVRVGRPVSAQRHIFLHHRAPFPPIHSSSTIAKIVRLAIRRAALTTQASGAHTFRHTVASQLVQHGVSFKTVADVLGHQSLQTTTIYAKLDLPSLATIGLPWPGGAQ
jgi:site-specific recombinase XerD